MNWNFYCDESGNTGTDWLNNDQPFFVYGGWLVQDQNKEIVRSRLSEITATLQGNEIKSKNVFKSRRGLNVFFDIFNAMQQNLAFPVFVISDKKFMVAAKIVETFFDSEYNKSLREDITSSNELKKALAIVISEN